LSERRRPMHQTTNHPRDRELSWTHLVSPYVDGLGPVMAQIGPPAHYISNVPASHLPQNSDGPVTRIETLPRADVVGQFRREFGNFPHSQFIGQNRRSSRRRRHTQLPAKGPTISPDVTSIGLSPPARPAVIVRLAWRTMKMAPAIAAARFQCSSWPECRL